MVVAAAGADIETGGSARPGADRLLRSAPRSGRPAIGPGGDGRFLRCFVWRPHRHLRHAAAFEHAVKQIPARRWLGLTATPYRRDKLDDLIALQLGPVRHTITHSTRPSEDSAPPLELDTTAQRPIPALRVHDTAYRYAGDADPTKPGGMAAIYRDLIADDARLTQIVDDVIAALERDPHCLLLTQ